MKMRKVDGPSTMISIDGIEYTTQTPVCDLLEMVSRERDLLRGLIEALPLYSYDYDIELIREYIQYCYGKSFADALVTLLRERRVWRNNVSLSGLS